MNTLPPLSDVLEHRADAALRRAKAIGQEARQLGDRFDITRAIDLEQALDDVDRYARLYDRVGALDSRLHLPYQPGGRFSMIADIVNQHTDADARIRLQALRRDSARREHRNTTAGLSGLLPPAYITSAVATQVAAGRPLADLIGSRPLPDEGITVETGRVTTGHSAAAQATENTATSNTDVVVSGVSIPVRTIATRATVSAQVFERAAGYRDGIIGDMLEAHAATVDSLLVSGTGASGQPTGFLSQASTQSLAYTDATPTAAEFLPRLAAVTTSASTARRRPVTAYAMHSRRWWWLASGAAVAGLTGIGERSIFGVPVTLCDSIPVSLGTGNNEDRVLAIRPDDHHLYEAGPYVIAETQPSVTGQLAIVVTVYSYLAFSAARYPTGVGILTGDALSAVAA
ncbi:MAG: phage major capsid protein [Actinobacteria bacterium]|uniref:Unannotated protein n=1 Tax=freshwater metagenome TaxID=449393 RepID=A0A6J6BLK6_9ZZZZ|nr:phage major capsid protein [Actinomycetota bacterium]